MLKYIAIAALAALPGQAFAQDATGIYTEIFAGSRLAGQVTVAIPATYDTTAGWAMGGAIGLTTPVPGLSFELEVLKTAAQTTLGNNYDTISVMANAEYGLALNETFEAYGSLGLGAVHVHDYYPPNSFEAWGAGYQVSVGGRAHISEQVAVFAEYKYVNTFEDVSLGNTGTRVPTHNLLAGLRFSF